MRQGGLHAKDASPVSSQRARIASQEKPSGHRIADRGQEEPVQPRIQGLHHGLDRRQDLLVRHGQEREADRSASVGHFPPTGNQLITKLELDQGRRGQPAQLGRRRCGA